MIKIVASFSPTDPDTWKILKMLLLHCVDQVVPTALTFYTFSEQTPQGLPGTLLENTSRPSVKNLLSTIVNNQFIFLHALLANRHSRHSFTNTQLVI